MPTTEGGSDDTADKWRLTVHQRGQAEPIGVVWYDGTELRGQAKGPAEMAALLEAIKPSGELFRDRMRWDDDGGAIGAPRSLRDAYHAALEAAGFEVRIIPFDDLEMRVAVDVSVGSVVGESVALYGTLNEGLAGDLFKRLRAMPENMAADLAAVVAEAVGRGDHQAAAAAALEKGQSIIILGNTPRLLELLRTIDVARLSHESRLEFLRLRLAVAGSLNDFGTDAGRDVQVLKEEFWSEVDEPAQEGVLLAEGCVAADAGRPDTGFVIWRSILDRPGLSASGRAWAYNNLASLLKATDPAIIEYAQLASDAYLQCGLRAWAARNVLRIANCILAEKPADAMKRIDEAIAWFAPDDPSSRDLRAGLLQVKADSLLRLGEHAQAEGLALQAAELRRGIHGAEERRCAALYLAAFAAKDGGHPEAEARYKQEADALAAKSGDAAGMLHRQIGQLLSDFDANAADRLDAQAVKQGDRRARATIEIARASRPGASHMERIAHLETAQKMLATIGGHARDTDLVHHGLGAELHKAGFPDQALPHYLRVLGHDPLNHEARQNAAALLFELGKWQDAVRFFADQLRVFGRKPGILYCYGRSLLESGDPERAVAFLNDARNAEGADPSVRKLADEYMNIALQRGGRAMSLPEVSRDERPISREELEECLSEFSAFIKGDKRMALWDADGKGGHKWTPSPEGVARDLLHTALKMRFRARLEVFEEVAAGAGRIDLYLRCQGGLAVILELKMLGAPYSSTYAFSGEGQVVHYMESKGIQLGYLVLFDARKRDFGTGLNATTTVNASTVRVVFVDVRPEAPSS